MAHVQKRGGGRWRARFRGPDNRERSKTFERRADAVRFLTTVEASKLRGEWVDPKLGRKAFGPWAEELMASRLNIRPATRARDDSYFKNHILPAFKDSSLARIRRADVQRWVRELTEVKRLAPRTVRECHRILSFILREAVDSQLIAASPCHNITLPRVEKREGRFLSAEEVERLADSIDPRYRAFVTAGLTWVCGGESSLASSGRTLIFSSARFESSGLSSASADDFVTSKRRRQIPVGGPLASQTSWSIS